MNLETNRVGWPTVWLIIIKPRLIRIQFVETPQLTSMFLKMNSKKKSFEEIEMNSKKKQKNNNKNQVYLKIIKREKVPVYHRTMFLTFSQLFLLL